MDLYEYWNSFSDECNAFHVYAQKHLADFRTMLEQNQCRSVLSTCGSDLGISSPSSMTKYIIGTISEIDTPVTAAAKGNLSLAAWLSGLSEEQLQREREEILDADEDTIRNLAALSHVVADTENICVIGSEEAVSRDADVFNTVGPLIRSQV